MVVFNYILCKVVWMHHNFQVILYAIEILIVVFQAYRYTHVVHMYAEDADICFFFHLEYIFPLFFFFITEQHIWALRFQDIWTQMISYEWIWLFGCDNSVLISTRNGFLIDASCARIIPLTKNLITFLFCTRAIIFFVTSFIAASLLIFPSFFFFCCVRAQTSKLFW